MPDTFDRIRAADPARSLPEEAEPERREAEALLERLVAEPVEEPRRRRRRLQLSRRRTFALGAAAAAAVAAVFALIVPDDERVPTGLATRAYALTNPADGVIHEVVEFRGVDNQDALPEPRTLHTRGERWLRPATGEYRWVIRDVATRNRSETAGDRRTERTWSQSSPKVQVRKALTEKELADVPPTAPLPQRSAVQQFRRAYETGRLRDAGPSSFDGRPTRRYVIERAEPERGLPRADEIETWEIDARTAQPLVMTVRTTLTDDGRVIGRQRLEQRIIHYEKLEPTPENLRKLRFVGPGG